MSRMLNVLRDTAARTAEVAIAPADPSDDFARDDTAPFVEVGGPLGPVYSPALTVVPKPTAAPPPPKPEVAAFPRLADPAPVAPGGPAYLSVTFHELTPRSPDAPRPDGPVPELVAFHLPDHPVSGEYRVLRDEVRRQLPDAAPHALLFTAAAAQAGTTTVVLNLAVTLALEARARVLVVDANVGRPAVAPRLALKDAPGLTDVLALKVPLAWALQPSVVPNLQILSAGSATPDAAVLLAEELPKFVPQLRQWFDWVLIDAGVWGELPERDAACPAADAVYLVTREPHVARPEFAGLRGWVKELGGVLRGYVATRL